MNKPVSESCLRNQQPLLDVIRPRLTAIRRVLEIGSGTGQHAVYFAAAMPHLIWQCSDLAGKLPGIQAWLDDAALSNTPAPLEIDVSDVWPNQNYDAVFSANTAHFMPWQAVEAMVAGAGRVLHPEGLFLLYGAFRYNGDYTSESNRDFDAWLKGRDPRSGVRDFEAVDERARAAGLSLDEDIEMPANNRLLIWRRR